MKELIYISILISAYLILPAYAENLSYLVEASGHDCKHGLHHQPSGTFAVFLFCDDALGSNIGVILTKPGVGPIEGLPNSKWGLLHRFWQDEKWSADVVNFAWSPSGIYLYVATQEIYGDGGLFKFNLERQTFIRIFPDTNDIKIKAVTDGYYTKIEKINIKENYIIVSVYDYSSNTDKKLITKKNSME